MRAWSVTITPTYSGCPAMHVIESEIRRALAANGLGPVEFARCIRPPGPPTGSRPAAQDKLEAYGIAPPGTGDRATSCPAAASGGEVRCPYLRIG